ncbi:phage tail tape measure protein [Paenibacillus agricola]|uniref:Phage tail tape measure protein n=1 Tax=Paenibacillus agricola TaxID=2716264 RepID=A0ABX0IZY4_9BACL|nr:phage tail tape measure protein [Paenibacillus agricola]NHN29447.1 phage tail tape measure protein [Paenibacillus agricola]
MANVASMTNSSGLVAQINQNTQNIHNTQINQISQINQIIQVSQQLNQFIHITNEVQESVENAESGFSKLGKSLANLGQVAASGIYSAFKMIGTASWDAAMEAEKSLNIMKIGTKATGAELDSLMASYEKVGAKVPDSMNTVASVMAEVHHSTGATGTGLEDMSGKILSLGSLTGVSTSTIGASLTGAMQSWSIGADQGGEIFDKLYFLSQKSGMGINTLSDKLVKFGGPMKNLGFDFDTSASLIAQWANNGLDADMVLGSFSTALGKMSKHGVKDTPKALENALNKIKNAKTITEATTWAMEAFGESAGPGMAAAIRDGSLEIGTMLDEMQNSHGIIEQTSADTETLGDKFEVLKKSITSALKPLGGKMLEWAGKAIPILENAITELSGSFDKLMPFINKFLDSIGEGAIGALNGITESIKFIDKHFKILGPVIGVVAVAFGVALSAALWSVAAAGWAAISPLLPFIAAVVLAAAYVAILAYAWNNNMFGIRDTAMVVFNSVMSYFSAIGAYFNTIMPYILQIVAFVWPNISSIFVAVLTVIWETVKLALLNVWNMIYLFFFTTYNLISFVAGLIGGLLSSFLQLITGDFSGAWNTFLETLKSILPGIGAIIENVFFKMFDLGIELARGLIAGISNAAPAILEYLSSLVNSIVSLFKGMFGIASPSKVMMEIGFWTTEGLAEGIEDGENRVGASSTKIVTAATTPYDKGMMNVGINSDQGLDPSFNKASAISAASYNSPSSAPNNVAKTEINPVINITVNGDGSGSTAQDIAERVKLAIQEVFESAARRQGIVGGEAWQL